MPIDLNQRVKEELKKLEQEADKIVEGIIYSVHTVRSDTSIRDLHTLCTKHGSFYPITKSRIDPCVLRGLDKMIFEKLAKIYGAEHLRVEPSADLSEITFYLDIDESKDTDTDEYKKLCEKRSIRIQAETKRRQEEELQKFIERIVNACVSGEQFVVITTIHINLLRLDLVKANWDRKTDLYLPIDSPLIKGKIICTDEKALIEGLKRELGDQVDFRIVVKDHNSFASLQVVILAQPQ